MLTLQLGELAVKSAKCWVLIQVSTDFLFSFSTCMIFLTSSTPENKSALVYRKEANLFQVNATK